MKNIYLANQLEISIIFEFSSLSLSHTINRLNDGNLS